MGRKPVRGHARVVVENVCRGAKPVHEEEQFLDGSVTSMSNIYPVLDLTFIFQFKWLESTCHTCHFLFS